MIHNYRYHIISVFIKVLKIWLGLKAVTEPNSAKHTAIAEKAQTESTGKDGNVRFSDTGI